ncbi:MAG: hypothetical protein KC652_14085 [Cyanobacteria bacterium HKST-UBA01]|nr:hypothetical protein [Cyanobacteria bacterium HKST-UBA01]
MTLKSRFDSYQKRLTGAIGDMELLRFEGLGPGKNRYTALELVSRAASLACESLRALRAPERTQDISITENDFDEFEAHLKQVAVERDLTLEETFEARFFALEVMVATVEDFLELARSELKAAK